MHAVIARREIEPILKWHATSPADPIRVRADVAGRVLLETSTADAWKHSVLAADVADAGEATFVPARLLDQVRVGRGDTLRVESDGPAVVTRVGRSTAQTPSRATADLAWRPNGERLLAEVDSGLLFWALRAVAVATASGREVRHDGLRYVRVDLEPDTVTVTAMDSYLLARVQFAAETQEIARFAVRPDLYLPAAGLFGRRTQITSTADGHMGLRDDATAVVAPGYAGDLPDVEALLTKAATVRTGVLVPRAALIEALTLVGATEFGQVEISVHHDEALVSNVVGDSGSTSTPVDAEVRGLEGHSFVVNGQALVSMLKPLRAEQVMLGTGREGQDALRLVLREHHGEQEQQTGASYIGMVALVKRRNA